MIIPASTVTTPVQNTEYQHTIFAVIRRFLSFGYAISRYTWASVSNPLIESSECPKAIIIATIGIWSQKVPANQPLASAAKVMFEAMGAGGRNPQRSFRKMVSGHQISSITTITVVICMIRSALPLDSWTPLIFAHQK